MIRSIVQRSSGVGARAWKSNLLTAPCRRRLLSSSSSPATPVMKTDYLGIFLFGGLSVGTGILGVWQLSRYFEKVAQIEDESSKFSDSAVVLPSDCNDLPSLAAWTAANKGRRIVLEGVFDHANEVKLGLRSAPSGRVAAKAQGLATNPQGYYILTPLKLSNGLVVVANRGWVGKSAESFSRPPGVVKLSFMVGGTEKPGTFSPKNDPAAKKLLWLEGNALLEATRLELAVDQLVILEVIVDEKQEAGPLQFPLAKSSKELSEHYVMPITHLVYSVTWFALCVAGMVMTNSMFRRRLRPLKKLNKIVVSTEGSNSKVSN